MQPLPIDPLLPEVTAALRGGPSVVIQAPPGSGKTTRVPRAILEAGLAGEKSVFVLQPRRLATRLAARRVAEEMNQRLGETVGYQVRFEEVAGPRTRLRFVTEGILTRRLLGDPALRDAGVVVFDEFHERHLEGDLTLALLRRAQAGPRKDLKLVVMSATLASAPVAAYLGDCPVLTGTGRPFDVAIEYLEKPDARKLDAQVASAVRRLLSEGLDGHVLIFFPGMAEIRRAETALRPVVEGKDVDIAILHGDLPAEEQDRAVAKSSRRKLILSTNVAETSVTVDGVVAVIDTGLARVASHSPWSGLPILRVLPVSRASAAQRAGRAGRTRPGRCLRLYTRQDHDLRPEHEAPEVRRLDLAASVLSLHALGVPDLRSFPWFEAPPEAAVEAAESLLNKLGALEGGSLTALGRELVALPLHPRLSRLLVEASANGASSDGCILAAVLGERDLRDARERGQSRLVASSDVLDLAERFDEAKRARFDMHSIRKLGLDPGAVNAVERQRRYLSDAAKRLSDRRQGARQEQRFNHDDVLRRAILCAYPDRVARRRQAKGADVLLCGGGSAQLAESSVVHEDQFMVAVDAETRRRGTSDQVVIRMASAIEPDWLIDLFPGSVKETRDVVFLREAERVESVSRLEYEGLVLTESRLDAGDPGEEARVLAEAVMSRGLEAFTSKEELDALGARVAFVAESAPDSGIRSPTDEDLRTALQTLCYGKRSFADLRHASLKEALLGRFDPKQRRLLDELAPEAVSLPGRAKVPVVYAAGRPPEIASRMQDFFGLARGPAVAAGRVPLVLHLLAPNHQSVQVTTDLAGFWQRTYPQVRRELSRRYPRHSWPEDPRNAPAPQRRNRSG